MPVLPVLVLSVVVSFGVVELSLSGDIGLVVVVQVVAVVVAAELVVVE